MYGITIIKYSAGSPLEFVHFVAGKRTYYLRVETNQISWNNYRYTESSSTTNFKLLDDFILEKFRGTAS